MKVKAWAKTNAGPLQEIVRTMDLINNLSVPQLHMLHSISRKSKVQHISAPCSTHLYTRSHSLFWAQWPSGLHSKGPGNRRGKVQHPRGVQIRARFPPCSLPVDFKLLQVECQRNPPKPSSQPFELCYVSKSKGTSRATSGCGARILTTRTGGSFFFFPFWGVSQVTLRYHSMEVSLPMK